ncbi:MAG: hypothetical protein LBT65_02400 [Synergistaceae bacterium]|jgi:hypothetical protein|nr:hypothetical protein [Synergistaceae bacterium]
MSNPVTLDLVTPEATIPAPDNLISGPKGVVHTDIVKVRVSEDSTLKRGTLLMSDVVEDENVFVPCTVAGLSAEGPNTFGILADTSTIAADEYAETGVYFEGDFNANAVILPWEIEDDDHDEQIEVAREALRRQKIFLRNVHK